MIRAVGIGGDRRRARHGAQGRGCARPAAEGAADVSMSKAIGIRARRYQKH